MFEGSGQLCRVIPRPFWWRVKLRRLLGWWRTEMSKSCQGMEFLWQEITQWWVSAACEPINSPWLKYPTLHNLWLFLRWNFSAKNASMLFLWKRAPPDCEDAVHSLEKEYLSGCCSTLLFFSGKSWQEVGKPFRCKISRVSSAEAAHPQQSKVRKDISESGTRAEDSQFTGG